MNSTDAVYAVLSGDVVDSTKLPSKLSTQAMEWLREGAAELGSLYTDAIVGRLDTFRHDSWQLLLARPALAFRAAIFLRASLKLHSDAGTKFDTRLSIGIGGVETISIRRVSDSRGPAFTLSGRMLDAMDHHRLAFGAERLPQLLVDALSQTATPLLDCLITDWTPTESRAVLGALKQWTQEMTAAHWPANPETGKRVTRQAVGLSLDRAHWGVIEHTLHWMEDRIEQALELA
jgi:hypothetical protein